jgi:hypothetical protein
MGYSNFWDLFTPCASDRRGGDGEEHAGKTALDGEKGSASIGDRETDVDRSDHH